MSKKLQGVLDVYPDRPEQKAVDVCELFTEYNSRRSSRRRGGVIFVKDQYTNQLVSFRTTNKVEPVQKPEKVVKKKKPSKVRRKRALRQPSVESKRPRLSLSEPVQEQLFDDVPNDSADEVPDELVDLVAPEQPVEEEEPSISEMVEQFDDLEMQQDSSEPLFVFGKMAIEYDNFDFSEVMRVIKGLSTFKPISDELFLRVLKLSDRQDTVHLKSSVQMRLFYEHQFLPAVKNLEKYESAKEEFVDVNAGKFERFMSENGYIVEVPMPPRPEIFPAQIRRRQTANRVVEHERLQDVLEAQVRNEEERRNAEVQAYRLRYMQAYNEQMFRQQQLLAQLSPLLFQRPNMF